MMVNVGSSVLIFWAALYDLDNSVRLDAIAVFKEL